MLDFESDNFLEGEPSIKNAHTATQIRVLHNNYVLVCMDESIFVYSLPLIAQNSASLVSVIKLSQVFEGYQKEIYEDFITSIFRNAEKQDFSSQIFAKNGDAKSNTLLKMESIKDRISFFNNNYLKVVKFQVNEKGELLILLADGRAAVLPSYDSPHQVTNLNEISKEKIKQACFVQPQGLAMVTNGNKILYVPDIKDKSKATSFKINIHNISQLYGCINVRERAELYVISSYQIHVLEIKKKLLSTHIIKIDDFITKTFFYKGLIYASTLRQLISIDLSMLTQRTIQIFNVPTELLYIDRYGSFIPKSYANNKEQLWVVDCTSNGVFVGQTIRRNGNYKQGRLIVFQPKISYFIKRLISSIKDNDGFINVKDSIFVNMTSETKTHLQEIINLLKTNTLIYQGTELSPEQYNTLCINVTHAFDGKQLVKQRFIQRCLKSRFQNTSSASKKHDLRCCFTGKQLYDEPLNHCKQCNLYGIQSQGNRCIACRGEMIKYE